MPSKEPGPHLGDTANAISLIEDFTVGMDFEAFCSDPKTVAAVERKLSLIREAALALERKLKCHVLERHGATFAESATGSGINMIALICKLSGEPSPMIFLG